MKCPKCNVEMVMLLTSNVCYNTECDKPPYTDPPPPPEVDCYDDDCDVYDDEDERSWAARIGF